MNTEERSDTLAVKSQPTLHLVSPFVHYEKVDDGRISSDEDESSYSVYFIFIIV